MKTDKEYANVDGGKDHSGVNVDKEYPKVDVDVVIYIKWRVDLHVQKCTPAPLGKDMVPHICSSTLTVNIIKIRNDVY